MKTERLIAFGILLLFSLSNIFALTITSVNMNPEQIIPGQTAIVKLELKNNGEKDIRDLSITLDLSQIPLAPYNSASEFNLENLDSDKTKNIEFKIIALNEAESGIYKIPVKIKYRFNEEEEIKLQESLISITLNSPPVVSANLEDGLLLKSRENEIRFKIINKGLSGVKFLEASLDSSVYYTVLSPADVYIGDIDSNDFDSVGFKIYFKDTAPAKTNVLLTLKYKDIFNKEYSQEINLPVKIYTKEQAISLGLIKKNNTAIYSSAILGFLIIWFFYRKWKKKRKIKKIKQEEKY